MNHRYGRHGFEAWSRLRKRRMNRFTRSMVPQARVAVLHIQLQFDNRERIFIVALDENGMQIENVRQMDVVDQYPGTRPFRVQESPTLKQLKYRAQMDAATMVETDTVGGEVSSEEALRSYARSQGLAYARDHITFEMAEGRTSAQLRDIYVEAFLDEYRAYLEHETRNGNLPDENTRRVRKKAREDRASDTTLHKYLSPRQIDYQAAIRALELLRLNTQNDTDYLAQIEKFADEYAREYTNDKEVKRDRLDRSDQFPETWHS